MRISDWSSDVCSSDLQSAGDDEAARGDPDVRPRANGTSAVYHDRLSIYGITHAAKSPPRLERDPQHARVSKDRTRSPVEATVIISIVEKVDRKRTRLNSSH